MSKKVRLQYSKKSSLYVFNLEQYKKNLFLNNLANALEKSESDLKNGNIYNARDVFQKLRDKYGY